MCCRLVSNAIVAWNSINKLPNTAFYDDEGKILVFDRYSLEKKQEFSLGKTSITRILWHAKINQIFVGGSNGAVTAFFDPEISTKGILLSMAKVPKRKVEDGFTTASNVYLPHALPIFQEGDDMDNERSRKRRDPVQSHRPEARKTGLFGPGKRGQIGFSETQGMMSMMIKDTSRDENPRDALLKHAKEAEENPIWIDHVYKKNQPKKIFDERKDEVEDREVIRKP